MVQSPHNRALSYMRRRKLPSLQHLSIRGNNLAFEEVCNRYKPLIETAAVRYGDKTVPFKDNLHHARLALWKTILRSPDKVNHHVFMSNFRKEMKSAVGNDSRGMLPRGRVSIDYWHNKIPDKKTSLNLHLMKNPFILKPNWGSINRQKKVKQDARQRQRKKKIDRLNEKARIEAAGFEEKAARRNVKVDFFDSLAHQVYDGVVKDPFLFKPSRVIRILTPIENGLPQSWKSYQELRRMKGGINPVEGYKIPSKKMKVLNETELEPLLSGIDLVIEDYASSGMELVSSYFRSLKSKIQREKAVPLEIFDDVEKLWEKSRRRTTETDFGRTDDETPF